MFKYLSVFFAVSALIITTGCHSISVDEDMSSPVPEANPDPSGFNAKGGDGYNLQDGDDGYKLPKDPGSNNWVDPEKLNDTANGADADGWVPVDQDLGMPVIYFAYDSDVLVPSETANLDKIAAYLKQNPSLGLVIEGHCDNRGTDEYNRALGERRANAIRAYLVKQGVPDNSLKTVSFGKDKPAVDGSGENIWKQNRRGVPVPMQIPGR